ncbi:MAG: YIP1 family protein [Anaerolineae bacterium]|nr:YIP1 family protein [Anaerolineae bacterium]
MEDQNQTFKPWLAIWIAPRRTIRKILEVDSAKQVMILAMLAGLARQLENTTAQNMWDALPVPLILAERIVLAPLIGLIAVNIAGALLRWTGGWLGGKASFEQVRTAFAWSCVPTIFIVPLWILKLLIFGEELFTITTPKIYATLI